MIPIEVTGDRANCLPEKSETNINWNAEYRQTLIEILIE